MLNEPPTEGEEGWRDELRRFLLGRLAKGAQSGEITRQRAAHLPTSPITRWWLFEGKRYSSLAGPLHRHFVDVERELRRLLATYHAALMITDQPQAGIDWGRTIALGPRVGRAEFVVQASRTGLSEDERLALVGWARWIEGEWKLYCSRVGLPESPAFRWFTRLLGGAAVANVAPALRRWMHVTRRSRWPLLRDIVSETLRVYLEPQELERIPLPRDRAQLFELLILTRSARALAPPPESIRWLDRAVGDNTVHVADIRFHLHRHLGRERVLRSGVYEASLVEAMRTFPVRIPTIADLVIEVPESSRLCVQWIIIEVKSGASDYADAVGQLRAYRAALPRSGANDRLLVWGVTEKGPRLTGEQAEWLRVQASQSAIDIWAFSSADDIHQVLELVRRAAENEALAAAAPEVVSARP